MNAIERIEQQMTRSIEARALPRGRHRRIGPLQPRSRDPGPLGAHHRDLAP